MNSEIKYMALTLEDFPIGKRVYYYYLPIISGITIGDVLTDKNGKQYRIIDGKTCLTRAEIDTNKYKPFANM